MKIIGDSIQYIEAHLLDDITVADVAESVNISPFYFQNAFGIMCGFTVAEYIRNRRLALAANDIISSDARIIDVAVKYGYDSADSFTKAFTRFHGSTPTAVRNGRATLKSFAPLKIKIILEGGNLMDYRIEHKDAFTVIGNKKSFPYEGAKTAIPAFWDEHFETGKGAVVMGEYGICIDEDMAMNTFDYMIADTYKGQEIPDGFVKYTVPSFDWAVFPCKGALPNTLQKVNDMIYTEWIPSTTEYEFAAGYCIEWYDDPMKYPKQMMDDNYYCEIMIPVKRK